MSEQEIRIRSIFRKYDLPDPPDKTVVNSHYKLRNDDWYVETEKGWCWLDKGLREWKYLPYGIPQW